jgi:hypothetical protein
MRAVASIGAVSDEAAATGSLVRPRPLGDQAMTSSARAKTKSALKPLTGHCARTIVIVGHSDIVASDVD